MSYFKVDILTPDSVLGRDIPADSLTVPTEAGEINVLESHTHLVSTLSTGILTVSSGGNKTYFCLTSGIVKVLKDRVTILSRAAEKAEDIDEKRAKKALEKSLDKLNASGALSDGELQKYRRKVERAEFRLKAYGLI